MSIFLKLVLLHLLIVFSISSCSLSSSRYSIADNHVIYNSPWGERTVENVHPATFAYIGGHFGKDKSNVYYGEKIIEGANPTTFKVIDAQTGKDDRYIFSKTEKCTSCDWASFRKLADHWYMDKDAAYYDSPTDRRRLSDIEPSSFIVINRLFAKDSKKVYIYGKPIVGADAKSFKLKDNRGNCEVCAEDKNRCYSYEAAVPCDGKPAKYFEFHIKDKPKENAKPYLDLKYFFYNDRYKTYMANLHGVGKVNLVSIDGSKPKKYDNSMEPGSRIFDFTCIDLNNNITHGRLSANVKTNHSYRFKVIDFDECSVVLFDVIWIRGQEYGPQISIQHKDGNPNHIYMEKPLYDESQELIIRCREITKSVTREYETVKKLTLTQGQNYQVRGHFIGDICEISIADQIGNNVTL